MFHHGWLICLCFFIAVCVDVLHVILCKFVFLYGVRCGLCSSVCQECEIGGRGCDAYLRLVIYVILRFTIYV